MNNVLEEDDELAEQMKRVEDIMHDVDLKVIESTRMSNDVFMMSLIGLAATAATLMAFAVPPTSPYTAPAAAGAWMQVARLGAPATANFFTRSAAGAILAKHVGQMFRAGIGVTRNAAQMIKASKMYVFGGLLTDLTTLLEKLRFSKGTVTPIRSLTKHQENDAKVLSKLLIHDDDQPSQPSDSVFAEEPGGGYSLIVTKQEIIFALVHARYTANHFYKSMEMDNYKNAELLNKVLGDIAAYMFYNNIEQLNFLSFNASDSYPGLSPEAYRAFLRVKQSASFIEQTVSSPLGREAVSTWMTVVVVGLFPGKSFVKKATVYPLLKAVDVFDFTPFHSKEGLLWIK